MVIVKKNGKKGRGKREVRGKEACYERKRKAGSKNGKRKMKIYVKRKKDL